MAKDFMYHGSPVDGIKVLEPRRASTPGIEGAGAYPRVFASQNPAYAAGHGFRWPLGTDLGFETQGDPVKLTIEVGQEQCLEQPLYLYVLPAEAFELVSHVDPAGYNYASDQPVVPLRVERFATVRRAIEFHGGIVEVRTAGRIHSHTRLTP